MPDMEEYHLTDDFAKKRCLLGKGAKTCSFLMLSGLGLECAKAVGNEMFYATLVRKRERGQMVAMGDNCSGPPLFEPKGT
jgi:hypothetical protein